MTSHKATGNSDPVPSSKQQTFDLRDRQTAGRERAFIEWLRVSHPSLHKTIAASTGLNSPTLKEALPVLLVNLQQKDSAQRRIALQAIYRLVEANDPNPFVRNVPQHLQESVISCVVAQLLEQDPTVRIEAVHTLSGFLPEPGDQLIGRMRFARDGGILKGLADGGVNHSDAQTAKSSIELLGRMEINLRSAAIPNLILALDHPDEAVRHAACNALQVLGEDSLDAVPELMRLFTSDDPTDVRVAAALALLAIQGYDSTVEQLRKKVKDWPGFLDFLRLGGDRLRTLRLALQRPQASTKKSAIATKPRINARMLEEISKNSEVRGFNSRQWAKCLKCAKSSVVETPTWKKLKEIRDGLAAERANDRRRRPKASEQQRD